MPTGTVSLVRSHGRSQPFAGSFTEDASAAIVAETPEALPLTSDASSPHWLYSATAEDNGTAGLLDGEPGVIYKGVITQAVRVNARDLVIASGIIAPEATDTIIVGVYKNSTLVSSFDNETVAGEIIVDELDAVTATLEVDTIVDAVGPGDVIRVAILGQGAETLDLDVAAGGALSIG